MKPYLLLTSALLLLTAAICFLRLPAKIAPPAPPETGLMSAQGLPSAPPPPAADTTLPSPRPVPQTVARPARPSAAEEVLKNLYAAYGNRQRPCPRLLLVQDEQGPRYRESAQAIVLDERSLRVCRAFGKDSLSALAFIVGHELAHFFQEEAGSGNAEFSYLAYDKNEDSSPEKERLADVQGTFNAYLAGYRTTAILPQLIAELYESYRLSSRLEGYPSLEERQQTSIAVLATIDTLTQLYETANYLSVFGHYELAAASYRYVLKCYPGREVYNNLGASHALQAMYCSKKSPDAWLYPIEIDTDSRLKKPRARGGEPELTENELQLRRQLLAQAEECLQTAGRMDPAYFPTDLNLLCVLTLQGKQEEAIRYFADQRILENARLSQSEKNKARLALGIAFAGSSSSAEKEQAGRIFQDLAASKTEPALAFMAAHNLKALQGNLPEKQPSADVYDCPLPFELFKVDDVAINRAEAGKWTPLPGGSQLGFFLKKLPSSTVLQFYKSGKAVIRIQRMSGASGKRDVAAPSFTGKRPQVIQTPAGFFLVCGEEHAVFLFGTGERLTEWGRYYAY